MKRKAEWPAVVFSAIIGAGTLMLTYVAIDPRFVERWHWPHFILSIIATALTMTITYKLLSRQPKQNVLVLQPETRGTLKLGDATVIVSHICQGLVKIPGAKDMGVIHYQFEVINLHGSNLGFIQGRLECNGKLTEIYPTGSASSLDTEKWPYRLLARSSDHRALFKLVKA